MSTWLTRGIALLIGCAGAWAWAVGLTVAQPLSEPAKPWTGGVTTNNMYWARDLRWAAVVVVLVALVLSVRGDRRMSSAFAAVAVLWLAVDTWLDRLDLGPAAKPWTLAGACGVVVGMWLAAQQGQIRPDRAPLLLATFIAAGVAPMAAGVTGPDAIDPPVLIELTHGLSLLLTGLALIGALCIAPQVSRPRLLIVGGLAWLFWMVLSNISQTSGARLSMATTVGAGLFAAVLAMSSAPIRSRRAAAATAAAMTAAALAYPILAFVSVMLEYGFAPGIPQLVTRLAGNPAVNSADLDAILTLAGIGVGACVGSAILAAPRARWYLDEYARLGAEHREARAAATRAL